MGFQSILGDTKLLDIKIDDFVMPNFFTDLNLDKIVQDIMDEQKLYDLRRFYYIMPDSKDTILYRLDVLRDLDNEKVYQSVVNFSTGMRKTREQLKNINDSKHLLQQQKLNLDAANCYIENISNFYKELKQEKFNSKGFQLFIEWLETYMNSCQYLRFKEDTEKLVKQFNEMKFHIRIKRDKVIIQQGYIEDDYCKQLLDTFQVNTSRDHCYQNNPYHCFVLSAMEQNILKVLYKPYINTFKELEEFHKQYYKFIDDTISNFEHEVQFYVAFRFYRESMKELKFHFCYPNIGEELRITDGYDLALAKKNVSNKKEVIFNNCYLKQKERFFVITGPNQGGKTTFARAIGHIIYFGLIGLMVPARIASIPLFHNIYTHFAVEESINNGAGKLKEELLRLKTMMEQVSKESFVIINEIFTSATSYDAYIMGKKVINYLIDMECQGVYVTHIYELTKYDDRIVSLVATLRSDESNIRTFRIERKRADGLSYANSIVQKHHMTYREIKERIKV